MRPGSDCVRSFLRISFGKGGFSLEMKYTPQVQNLNIIADCTDIDKLHYTKDKIGPSLEPDILSPVVVSGSDLSPKFINFIACATVVFVQGQDDYNVKCIEGQKFAEEMANLNI